MEVGKTVKLEIDGYENLGEENGVISFVKSFEIEKS